MSKYRFVIDTNLYSGNFERQMCAYLTGQVGECGVGEKEAKLFNEEVSNEVLEEFSEIVISEPDEHGCSRPARIWPTPGRYNNGLGFNYSNGEEELANQKRIEYIENNKETSCWASYLKVLKNGPSDPHYAGIVNVGHTIEGLEKAIQRDYDHLMSHGLGKYPACESVSILFSEKPSQKLIDIMKARATAYEPRQSGLKVIGFRLVEETVSVMETKL